MIQVGELQQDRNDAVGVDFGTRSTKVLALNKIGERIDIESAGSFRTIANSISNGVITETKAMGKALAKFVQSNDIRSQKVVFDVPSNLAALRWVNLPPMPASDLREAAKYKVRKHLPFPLESAYIEAAPTIDASKEENSVLIIAVPKSIIDSRAEAILNAGLVPARAELEAQAILRVVERRLNRKSALWRDASLTIIDFGGTNTHMYVVQNQQLQFIRGVRFGSQMFHEAVSDRLSVSIETAEKLLHDPSTRLSGEGVLTLPFDGASAIVNITPELEKLTKEVSRLMRYFRSLHPERSYAGILDQAILCGGLVGLEGFAEYLEKQLGLRVEFARPIAGMMTRFSRETFANVSGRQEAYTIVMGLALGGIADESTKRNQIDGGREFNWIRTA